MKKNYFEELGKIFVNIQVSNKKGKDIVLSQAILKIVNLINIQKKKGNKLIFIGNGGSASIASHMATDCLKNANIPAITFNDPSLITCISNDLGYEYVFQKPIEILAKDGDILFAISSSGKSKSILNACREAKRKGCFIVSLSGFHKKNPLRRLGDINFYIPSNSYGHVEITHLAICHYIIDTIIDKWIDSK